MSQGRTAIIRDIRSRFGRKQLLLDSLQSLADSVRRASPSKLSDAVDQGHKDVLLSFILTDSEHYTLRHDCNQRSNFFSIHTRSPSNSPHNGACALQNSNRGGEDTPSSHDSEYDIETGFIMGRDCCIAALRNEADLWRWQFLRRLILDPIIGSIKRDLHYESRDTVGRPNDPRNSRRVARSG